MRAIVRVLTVSLLAAGGAAAVAGFTRPAPAEDAAYGGVIKVRIALTSQAAGQPVDVQATVADGYFAGEDREVRSVAVRGRDGASVVVELTHTGRVTLTAAGSAVRAVATYAAEPPGVRVSEAQWRALSVATSGTRVELRRTGSFVSVVAPGAAVTRVAGER